MRAEKPTLNDKSQRISKIPQWNLIEKFAHLKKLWIWSPYLLGNLETFPTAFATKLFVGLFCLCQSATAK